MGLTKLLVISRLVPHGHDEGCLRMLPRKRPEDDSLPPASLAREIAACECFEAAWSAGQPRRIEDKLAAAEPPVLARLLRELLSLELALSQRDGRTPYLEAYLARFPNQADIVREVFRLATAKAPCRETQAPVTDAKRSMLPEGYELPRKLGPR
jgi:hypothetical protein